MSLLLAQRCKDSIRDKLSLQRCLRSLEQGALNCYQGSSTFEWKENSQGERGVSRNTIGLRQETQLADKGWSQACLNRHKQGSTTSNQSIKLYHNVMASTLDGGEHRNSDANSQSLSYIRIKPQSDSSPVQSSCYCEASLACCSYSVTTQPPMALFSRTYMRCSNL